MPYINPNFGQYLNYFLKINVSGDLSTMNFKTISGTDPINI